MLINTDKYNSLVMKRFLIEIDRSISVSLNIFCFITFVNVFQETNVYFPDYDEYRNRSMIIFAIVICYMGSISLLQKTNIVYTYSLTTTIKYLSGFICSLLLAELVYLYFVYERFYIFYIILCGISFLILFKMSLINELQIKGRYQEYRK